MPMSRRFRLHQPGDFARIRELGTVLKHPYFVMTYHRNELTHNRYAVVTSKRLGNAVQRNRTRRVMWEAIRLIHPRLQAGYDVVWVARTGAVGMLFRPIQDAINQTLKRAGLLLDEDTTL